MSIQYERQNIQQSTRQPIYEQEALLPPILPPPRPNPQLPSRPPRRKRARWFVVGILLIALVLVIASGSVFVVQLSSRPVTRVTPVPTAGITPTPVPTSAATDTATPTPAPRPSPTPAPTASLAQRIDTYIDHLTQTQQIGQLLMLVVYTSGYSSAFNQPLEQWDIANAILYNQYNGGPLMPTTLSGWTQLAHDLQAHANQSLILATDEEGGCCLPPPPSSFGTNGRFSSRQRWV